MASLCNYSIYAPANLRNQHNSLRIRPLVSMGLRSRGGSRSLVRSIRISPCQAADAAAQLSQVTEDEETAMNIENLHGFINLNMGKWNGSFHQFDASGNLLHKISTKLSASSYGEDELISLIQTLYIKQSTSNTSISGYEDEEPEWAEYKIKESNMFTVDKYQQIGYFPKEKAFALRYQTAGMLEHVLRQGVLGEDDTGEESPRNLKLPSRRPSIVCENCLYSQQKDLRARAFHILDPKGFIDMFLIFLEEKDDGADIHPSLDSSNEEENKVNPFLGTWKGYSLTKRSGVYGATIAEADTVAVLEMDGKGQLVQEITTIPKNGEVSTKVDWTGTLIGNVVTFEEAYQWTLLPGGMYMGCPVDVAKSIAELKSFHLEFCWMEAPGKRQRLVRTYDVEGLAVSSTYFVEVKSSSDT